MTSFLLLIILFASSQGSWPSCQCEGILPPSSQEQPDYQRPVHMLSHLAHFGLGMDQRSNSAGIKGQHLLNTS